MTAMYVWVATAVEWVKGLRISTHAQRQAHGFQLAGAEHAAHLADLQREKAEAAKREAQRLLAILSDPLKDWDLADFPVIATDPLARDNFTGVSLGWEHASHLRNVIEAYRVVARPAAQARMSVTTNDMLRDRTWGDEPRQPRASACIPGRTGCRPADDHHVWPCPTFVTERVLP